MRQPRIELQKVYPIYFKCRNAFDPSMLSLSAIPSAAIRELFHTKLRTTSSSVPEVRPERGWSSKWKSPLPNCANHFSTVDSLNAFLRQFQLLHSSKGVTRRRCNFSLIIFKILFYNVNSIYNTRVSRSNDHWIRYFSIDMQCIHITINGAAIRFS